MIFAVFKHLFQTGMGLYPDLANNTSTLDILDDSPPPEPVTTTVLATTTAEQWAGVGGGTSVALVALIAIAVLIKRNLEALEGVLVRLQTLLTTATNWLRRNQADAATSPQPAHPEVVVELRNLSDSQRIGIREMAQRDCHPQVWL